MTKPRSDAAAGMLRATVIACVDQSGEVEAAKAWLRTWRSRLTCADDQKGCGCCVVMYEVEGPREALDAIPASVLASGPGWDTYHRGRS